MFCSPLRTVCIFSLFSHDNQSVKMFFSSLSLFSLSHLISLLPKSTQCTFKKNSADSTYILFSSLSLGFEFRTFVFHGTHSKSSIDVFNQVKHLNTSFTTDLQCQRSYNPVVFTYVFKGESTKTNQNNRSFWVLQYPDIDNTSTMTVPYQRCHLIFECQIMSDEWKKPQNILFSFIGPLRNLITSL